MKQISLILLMMAFLLVILSSAKAADVRITVNGKVVARPCTVSTTRATVDLGPLETYDLINPGSASGWQSVNLNLTNCPIGTSRVVATFSGVTDSTGFYKNQGTAGNMQLELQSTSNIRLNNGSEMNVQVNDSSLSTSFPLKIRALTVNGGATQGTIQAIINVTYTYA
ncbi:TPA: fimbrial protein [Klebsiella quasipneumoniae subsp. similipneumoniae]